MKVARKRLANTLSPKSGNVEQTRHPSKLVTKQFKLGRKKGFRSNSAYPRADSVVR